MITGDNLLTATRHCLWTSHFTAAAAFIQSFSTASTTAIREGKRHA
jgi:hypothetical protein